MVRDSVSIRHTIGSNSTASFSVRVGNIFPPGFEGEVSPPRFGDEVEIREVSSGRTWFSGTVLDPTVNIQISDVVEIRISAIGIENAFRSILINGVDGVRVVEAATGQDQFNELVMLLPGFTGDTDIGAGTKLTTDLRYKTVGDVLLDLANRNDSILTITPGKQVILRRRSALSPNPVGRLSALDVANIKIQFDARTIRSRQLIRYGDRRAQRTIVGDGTTRAFPVAGTQSTVSPWTANAPRPFRTNPECV